MRCTTIPRIILLGVAGALAGCGAHECPCREVLPAPGAQAAVEPEEEAVVQEGTGEIEAPPFVYPVADCVPSTIYQSEDGTMKVATTPGEFVALTGCEPSAAVDWSREHVALVNFMAIGVMYYFQDVSMEGDTAVVKVTETTLIGGAGISSKAQFFVRIPASAAGAKLVIEYSMKEWNGPPQNPPFPSAPTAPPAGPSTSDAAPAQHCQGFPGTTSRIRAKRRAPRARMGAATTAPRWAQAYAAPRATVRPDLEAPSGNVPEITLV